MGKKKTSLVLEGGGMRGAYTAGALSWLLDEGIEFDNAYGISTGAVHLCSFLLKNQKYLHDLPIYYIVDKRVIGVIPFLRSGRIVDYFFLFREFLPNEIGFDISGLKDVKTEGKIGLYECELGKTVYKSVQEISMDELHASTSLPLIGKLMEINKDRHIMDGGITEMIPINEAIKDGCTKHLIITTKPASFVRKPAKKAVVDLMYLVYPKWRSIGDDYNVRHLNYNDQISKIKALEENNDAVYVYPSRETNVTRLGGKVEDLEDLFELGRSDMEARRAQILALFK